MLLIKSAIKPIIILHNCWKMKRLGIAKVFNPQPKRNGPRIKMPGAVGPATVSPWQWLPKFSDKWRWQTWAAAQIEKGSVEPCVQGSNCLPSKQTWLVANLGPIGETWVSERTYYNGLNSKQLATSRFLAIMIVTQQFPPWTKNLQPRK